MTLIIKTTKQCNLRCRYCCVGTKETGILSAEDIEIIIDQYAELNRAKGLRNAHIIFHGGEPMLLTAQCYARVMQYAQENYSHIKFDWKMQTNGTLLTEEMLGVLKKFNVSVGVSIDGTEQLHDSNRVYQDGRGTYRCVMGNIKKLMDNGISVASLLVYSGYGLTIEPCELLADLKELDIPVKINPLINCGAAIGQDDLTGKNYGQYMIDIFKYLIKSATTIRVSPIDDIFNAMIYGRVPNECTFSEECGKNFLCVDEKGDVYPCGRFADMNAYHLGDIKANSLLELYECDKLDSLRKRKNACSEACEFGSLCNGGCPAEAMYHRSSERSYFCDDYQVFFKYLINEGIDEYIKVLKKHRRNLTHIQYSVETLSSDDTEGISEILNFEIENMGDMCNNANRVVTEDDILVIARWQDMVVGFIDFRIDNGILTVESMQIHKDFRKTLVFKNLIAKAYECAKPSEVNSDMRILIQVHESNKSALRIYKRMGFQITYRKAGRVHCECDWDTMAKIAGRWNTRGYSFHNKG